MLYTSMRTYREAANLKLASRTSGLNEIEDDETALIEQFQRQESTVNVALMKLSDKPAEQSVVETSMNRDSMSFDTSNDDPESNKLSRSVVAPRPQTMSSSARES